MTTMSPACPPAPAAPSAEREDWIDPTTTARATRAARARQVSSRRRNVDPTTCDRDYTAAELEFMRAMQEYKARSGRPFPTWSEVLEVVRELGYRKDDPAT